MSSNWVWDYYNNNTKEKKGENRSQNAGSWVEDYYKYGKTDTSGVDDAYLDTFVSDATKFFGDVDAKKVSYTDAFSAIDDLSSRYDTVQAYLFQNKDKYGKDRYKQLSDAMGSIKSTFDSVGEYYSQWGDQEEYDEYMMGWLDQDAERTQETVEQRKAKYQANAERIEQIENLIGGNIFERSFNTFFGPQFTDPNARDALYAEKEALISENKRYEREQKALDDYYVPVTNEFLNNAGYRDYENATPEQFWEHDRNAGAAENALRQGGYRGEDGTVYDKNGNIVQSPVVVEDKLGLYLAESDKHYNPPGDNVGEYWRQIMLGTRGGWDQLTEHEINIYYDLYKREGQEAAYRYLDAMAPTLTKRQTEAMYGDIERANGLELAFYNAASIPLNILGGAHAFVTDSIKLASGEEYNPYSEDHRMQNAASYIREITAGRIDEATGGLAIPVIDFSAGDAYQALMSGADSLVGSAIGGTAYGVLMGMGAASSTATDLYNKGATTEQIIYGSLLAGAAEMVFEKFSIDKLVKTKNTKRKRDIIVNMLKQGGVEASEEMATEIANTITNVAVMGSQSDWVDINTFIKNVVNAGLGGFISGGGIGGIYSVGQKLANDAADREINKMFKNAYDGQKQRDLVAEGLELDPQSAYFKRLEQKLGKGKDLSGSEIREAVTRNERMISKQQTEQTDADEVAEQQQDTAKEAAEQTAQNAPKIAQERTESAEAQTVTERENAPVAKETAEQAEVTRETTQEDVQTLLAEYSKGYDAQAKAMEATYIEGQDVAEYDAAFRQVYDMGASGVSYSFVEGSKSYLTDSQKKIAYEAGKASQDAKATAREQEITKQATGGTKRKKGVVRGQGVSLEELMAKFNDTQRQAYKIMSTIAEITGIDIVLYKSKADLQGNFKGAQGVYKKESEPGTLYIDVNAGLNNIKSAGDLANYTMLRTFSHEFVHFIENWNPVWYNELRRAVFDHLENADELISREAAESGLDYEGASREVVAEALTDVLPDSTFLEDLANNHKNIFEKLYAKFKEFAANINKHFASLSPNANKAAQTLKQSGKYAEEIVKLFDKAATGAVENYQATVAEQQAETVKQEVKAEPKEKSIYEKYSEIKEQHPESMVLYRVGDFYEIIGEDAKVASEVADLTLTGRSDGAGGRVAMVGFPFHTLDRYAEKLRTVSRVAIVEADGNVIEMSKAEAQQIDQEKPKKAKKPKKIASTEAVITEESADTSKIEQESAKSDVTVEQAKKNLKKAITMPIQGTNEEALLAGIISKELTFDMVSYHGNYPGFSPVQRAHLVQKLIEGVYTDDKVIKIDVPYDGKFEINNTPEIVASALHTLKVRVPQEIVWDKKAYTHFKNEGRVAVMKHGGQDYITDGGLMLSITDAAAKIALRELRAEFREYPEGFDEIVANATVPVTNAPFEAEIEGKAVYVFDIGGEKVYFDKKRFAFIDGGVLTYAKGQKFSVIKSVNADGSLIGYLINVKSPKTDIEDGKPTKLKSFSKKKGAKGEVQYQSRAYTEQDQAYMDVALTSGKPGKGMSYEVSVKDYTLKEVANMYHLGNLGAEYDALFDKVYAFCMDANVAFAVEPVVINDQGEEVPGKHGKGVVTLSQKHFNSKAYTDEQKSRVILHEMLHAATTYSMINYYKIRKGDATVNMPKNIYDSCMEINRVFNAIKESPNFEGMYGKKDSLEMIAELSNPDFVKELQRTYPSLWHELLDVVCRLFGINKRFNNYAKLQIAVNEILTHPDYQLAKDYFVGDGKTTHYLEESQYANADVQEQRTLEDTDASYMAAVEDGDTETLQRMVEKAAREAGFDSPKLYHGTNTFGFTSIDTKKSNDRVSFFATDSLETAGTYSGTNKVRELGEQSASSLGIYQFYANTEGMLELDADGAESNHIKLDVIEKKFNDFMMTKSWKTHATAKQLAKYAKQSGYSGVIIKNVIDTATPESRSAANPSTVYIFFDPQKQLTSADTVTYDDDGYVVPLFERFSSESTDIRYQRRDGRMTDQEVLAYAVDLYKSDATIAEGLTEAEKGALEVFEKRIGKLDSLIAERAEQGRIYRENTFQKGGDRELAQKAHNRMEVLDGQIARASAQLLDVQEKTVLQGVLQKARKVVEQQERARGDEKLKRWRDRRENAAQIKKYRDRIEADYKDLVDWLNHPLNKDVTKHVNENIKGIVIPFLLTFDFTSKQQLRGGEATKADKAHVEQAQKLLRMLNGLDDEVRYSGEYDLPLNFSERLAKHVETVQRLMDAYEGETVINRMSAEELRNLSELLTNLKTALQTLNKFHTNAMFAHVSVAAVTTIRDLKSLKDYDGTAIDNFLQWRNIRPSYAWERFGKCGLSIEQELRAGQAKLGFHAKAIIIFSEKTFTAKEREEWENKVVEVSISYGRTVKTTVAALMSFYELSKREQGRKHILDGGVTVSDVEIREKKFSRKKRISGSYGRFTEADIDAMNAALTDRQKEVADALQQFMEKQGGEWGNHVTLARFGEKAFGEKGYFPIYVDKDSLSSHPDENNLAAALYRLLNMGFTKKLSENTKQPLVLYSIFDVFSTHMADMAQYNAMALPVLDAIRWLNYKEYDLDTGAETNNLRRELRRAFGSRVVKGTKRSTGYAENFITGILKSYNGTEAQGTPGDALYLKVLHLHNRAQIAYNMRVVVQQPTAIIRAAMVLKPKYLIKALDVKNAKKIKATVEEMHKHSGIAVWKSLGYYDVNISRGLTQMIKREYAFGEKFTDIGMKFAELADTGTWAAMWYACKLQLADQGITDEKQVARLFEDVIYKTQVVDSVLTKSEYMRDKGFAARMTSSFMSEPVATASMWLGAYDKLRMDVRKGASIRQAWKNNRGNLARVAIVFSVSAIINSAIKSVIDGMRDDDDYQTFAEKWLEAFKSNLFDEAIPKLPIIQYLWELVKTAADVFLGWDVYGNAPDDVIAQMYDSIKKIMEIANDMADGESNYGKYAIIYKLVQVASGLFGVPLAPIVRSVQTIWNNSVGAFAPSLKIKTYELKEESEIKYAVLDGYLTEDEAADELLDKGIVYDREEAELTAELWAYIADHKEYSDLSVSAYSLYKENCKGVDMGYFYQAWKYYNQAEADRDKDGEPIAGTKKRKVLDFIYQMRIPASDKKKIIKCFYD